MSGPSPSWSATQCSGGLSCSLRRRSARSRSWSLPALSLLPDRWGEALDAFFGEYEDVYVDAKARAAGLFRVTKDPADAPDAQGRFWHASQVLDDDQSNHDWAIHAWIDLNASDEAETPVVRVWRVGEL